MTLHQVARGDPSEVESGVDVAVESRALSVAEIQHALRQLRTARARPSEKPGTRGEVTISEAALAAQVPRHKPVAVGGMRRGDNAIEFPCEWGDTDWIRWGIGVDTGSTVLESPSVTPVAAGLDMAVLVPGWLTVVAAHSGAGASTVALAITDAAGVAARTVHLVDATHPSRCGLVAAAAVELGTDGTGEWRRGARARATLDRRAGPNPFSGWPSPLPGGADLTIVDLGSPTPQEMRCIVSSSTRVVLVCRPTMPGLRAAEQLLVPLSEHAVVLAVVGPAKWPREVAASAGPRLMELRAAHRIVAVPRHRALEVSGLISAALPKQVIAAGRALLELIDTSSAGNTTRDPSAPIGAPG